MPRRAVPLVPRRVMMRAMPLAMMTLPRARHANNQQRRNHRNQNQLDYVFHVKSPDS